MKRDVRIRRAHVEDGDFADKRVQVLCNGRELDYVASFDSDEGWAELMEQPLREDITGEYATYKVYGQIIGYYEVDDDESQSA